MQYFSIMTKILPHTERFIVAFNKLRAEKKLPTNAILATQIGLKGGNSITEISGRRQNIGLGNLQKFAEIYGPDNGFTFEELAGTSPFPKDGKEWERARMAALEEEIAGLKTMVYSLLGKDRSLEECLDDIDDATTKILARRRRSERKDHQ